MEIERIPSFSSQLPAVIIAGGHTVGVALLRALRHLPTERVLVSYDANDMGRVSCCYTELVIAPHPEHEEDAFIEAVLALSRRYPRAVLFPASDYTLKAFSRRKAELEGCFRVACEEWQVVQQVIDKKHTYALAETAGVCVPRTLLARSVKEVQEFSKQVTYPCLVKPCQSHLYFDRFHHKMTLVQNARELIEAYSDACCAGLEVMLQEFIPGDDLCGANYNAYYHQGEPLVEFTARKIRNAPPDLGSPCVVLSDHIPEILEPGRRMLRALRFSGFACTEFKRDPRDNRYRLIEVNARHNLSGLLAPKCGINFPEIHYRHLAEGLLPPPLDFQDGIYWIDTSRDLAYSLKRCLQGRYSLTDLLKPYLGRHVFALIDRHDPRPAMHRAYHLVAGSVASGRNGKISPPAVQHEPLNTPPFSEHRS